MAHRRHVEQLSRSDLDLVLGSDSVVLTVLPDYEDAYRVIEILMLHPNPHLFEGFKIYLQSRSIDLYTKLQNVVSDIQLGKSPPSYDPLPTDKWWLDGLATALEDYTTDELLPRWTSSLKKTRMSYLKEVYRKIRQK